MISIVNIPSVLRRHYPILLYLLGFLFSCIAGMRMEIPFPYFQLQARDWLLYDLWRSILYLHAQPPLPNLWLGFALKGAWLTGLRPESLLLAFHFCAGLFAAYAIGSFTRDFIRNPRMALVCNVILLLHPCVYASMHQYFYTFHEWVLLGGLAWGVRRHAFAPSAGKLLVVAILLALTVYTRSLFHFLWAFAAISPLAWHTWHSIPTAARRRVAMVCGAFALTMLAWPMKNLMVFGFFGYSSWQGANFSQGIAMKDFPIGIDTEIPESLREVPCLREKLKLIEALPSESVVAYNYNHYSLIETSRKLQELSMEMIRNDPGIFLRKLRHNFWAFVRFTGRQPHYAEFGMGEVTLGPVATGWMRGWEILLNQDFRTKEQLKAHAYRLNPEERKFDVWLPSLLWITFPLVLLLSIIQLIRNRRRFGANEATVLFLGFTIVWVLTMVLLIDGREGNRMRFSTETYFIWLVFWIMDGFLARNKIEPNGDPTS